MMLHIQCKINNTVECRVHLQRSKPKMQCYNCIEDHFIKDCPKPKSNRKTSDAPSLEHNPSINMIFNKSAHIPLDMGKNINKHLPTEKLNNQRITKYVQKQFPKSRMNQKMVHFAKGIKNDPKYSKPNSINEIRIA